MFEIGSIITYNPEFGNVGIKKTFKDRSVILERLIDSGLFTVISMIHGVSENNEEMFLTELRYKNRYNGYIRFTHTNMKILNVVHYDEQLNFDALVVDLDKESRIKALHMLDILQDIWSGVNR